MEKINLTGVSGWTDKKSCWTIRLPLKVDLQAVGLPVDLHGAALKLPAYIGRLLVPGQFLNPAL